MSAIKLINIVGARPQIIKASAISRAIRLHFADRINEITIHTGQHYDKEMSAVFFDELEIHKPDYNLEVGSASHGRQISMMIIGIEEILTKKNLTVSFYTAILTLLLQELWQQLSSSFR
jgi:UDP-GlcNAc3NAcA epimerase